MSNLVRLLPSNNNQTVAREPSPIASLRSLVSSMGWMLALAFFLITITCILNVQSDSRIKDSIADMKSEIMELKEYKKETEFQREQTLQYLAHYRQRIDKLEMKLKSK